MRNKIVKETTNKQKKKRKRERERERDKQTKETVKIMTSEKCLFMGKGLFEIVHIVGSIWSI